MTSDDLGRIYDRRASQYTALLGDIALLSPVDASLIRRWGRNVGGTFLDAGCGPGHWSAALADEGNDVHGVDVSAAFVEIVYAERRRDDGQRAHAAIIARCGFSRSTHPQI